MRKVELRWHEQLKYETIKELVDHHGNKRRAALKLNLSIRQVNRLINVYKAKGKAGFVHGNRNRRPANSLPQELGRKIIALYALYGNQSNVDKYIVYLYLSHYVDNPNYNRNSPNFDSIYADVLTSSDISAYESFISNTKFSGIANDVKNFQVLCMKFNL